MAFTCPVCKRVSHHPKDEESGYCGACRDFTGGRPPALRQLNVLLDKLPPRCQVMFAFCGPITTAYAENVDTKATGPLVKLNLDESGQMLLWSDLDPEGKVAGE